MSPLILHSAFFFSLNLLCWYNEVRMAQKVEAENSSVENEWAEYEIWQADTVINVPEARPGQYQHIQSQKQWT